MRRKSAGQGKLLSATCRFAVVLCLVTHSCEGVFLTFHDQLHINFFTKEMLRNAHLWMSCDEFVSRHCSAIATEVMTATRSTWDSRYLPFIRPWSTCLEDAPLNRTSLHRLRDLRWLVDVLL